VLSFVFESLGIVAEAASPPGLWERPHLVYGDATQSRTNGILIPRKLGDALWLALFEPHFDPMSLGGDDDAQDRLRRSSAGERRDVPAEDRSDRPEEDLQVEERRAAIEVLRVQPKLRRQDLLPIASFWVDADEQMGLIVELKLRKAGDARLRREDLAVERVREVDECGILGTRADE
jgi:hypothetical protein